MNTSPQNFLSYSKTESEQGQNQAQAYREPSPYFSSPLLVKRRSQNKVQSRQFFKKSLLTGLSPENDNAELSSGWGRPGKSESQLKKGLPSQIYFPALQPHNSPRKQKKNEEHYKIQVKEVCAPSTLSLELKKVDGSRCNLFGTNRILGNSDIYETNTSVTFERTSSLLTTSSTPHSQLSTSFQHEEPASTQQSCSQNYGILAAGFNNTSQSENISVFQITPPTYQPHSPRKRDSQSLSPRKSRLLSTRDYLLNKVIQNYDQYQYEPQLLKTEEKTQCYLEVSPTTVAEALYNKNVNLLIVDCRFDYEYEGGHIQGALNISSPFKLQEELLHCAEKADSRFDAQTAIVFHCQFSSKRGPAMFTMMRDLDRKLVGIQNYPQLLQPEMYVLKGGYSKFYQQYPELCECGYTPMTAQKAADETQTMSHFEQNQVLYQQDIKKMF